MKTSKPFTFILHIISKNEWITDLTITGIAYRFIEPGRKIEDLSYSITQIILDRDDITNIASYVDMQQINNACFNFAQTLFTEYIKLPGEITNFPGLPDISAPNFAN